MKRVLVWTGIAGLCVVLCAGVIVAQRVTLTKATETVTNDGPNRSERLVRRGSRAIEILPEDFAQGLRTPAVSHDKVALGMLQQMERAGMLLDGGEVIKGTQLLNALAAIQITGVEASDQRIAKAYLSMGAIAERASLDPNLQVHFLAEAVRWMNPEGNGDLIVDTIQRIASMLYAIGDDVEAARLEAIAANFVGGATTHLDLGLQLELQNPSSESLGGSGGGGGIGPDTYEIDNDLTTANPIGFRNNGNGQGNQFGRDNRQIQTHTMWPDASNNFDDIDVVTFELNGPSLVRIETAETDDPSLVDTIIGLTNGSGQVLASNDDQAPGDFTSKLELCLPGDEPWYVSTVGFFIGQIFEYDMIVDVDRDCAFEDEPNASCDQANPLGVGDSTNGIHTSGFIQGDQDWYSFSLGEAGFVSIETGGSGDTTLSLYGGCPDPTLIAFNDDGGPGLLSLIQVPLDAGTYYINAQAFSAGAYYAYSLSLEVTEPPLLEGNPNDTCAEAAANNTADLDTSVLGSISPSGERDYYLLNVPSDQAVEVETFGSLSDTVVNLSNAAGTVEYACDDDSGDGFRSLVGCCLAAGDYCVGVKAFSSFTTGDYEIEFRSGVSCTPLNPPACSADGGVGSSCAPF